MMALAPRMYADLIGKPFAFGGRGPGAYDCWGVLQETLRREGRAPTDFPSDPALLRQALSDEWQPVEFPNLPQAGDGILLRSADSRYEWHVGRLVDSFRFLHAREGVGVCVERFDSLAYKRRIAGFYRFRGRAD